MAAQTISTEFLNAWVCLPGWVKSLERGNPCFGGKRAVFHCKDSEERIQIRLCAKGKADAGNCACIRRLNTGHHALDVVAIFRFTTGVTVAPAAGFFHHRETRRVRAAAHAAVCKIGIECQSLAAVTAYTAERFKRMGLADLRQVRVTSKAIFRLASECWCQGDGFWVT